MTLSKTGKQAASQNVKAILSNAATHRNAPRYLADSEVQTAEEEGWGQIITCGQNVRYRQNLTHRKISMAILGSNIWPSVRQKVASPGSFEFIEIAPPPKRRLLPGPPI